MQRAMRGAARVRLVPGHGEVTDVSLLRDIREYLRFVRAEAGSHKTAGADVATATAEISAQARKRWDGWENPEWIDFAVRVCYS